MSIIENIKSALRKHQKSILQVCLTFSFLFLNSPVAQAQCSVHNHGCVFHALGMPVTVTPPIVNAGTAGDSVVFYGVGSNQSGGPAKTDFDVGVLLPSTTTYKDASGATITRSTGPYIVSDTKYGKQHTASETGWTAAEDNNRFVYPSQYQIIFNQNTAQANHTGDINGLESIPNAKGCPASPGSPSCEAVIVTGNVPSGTYKQQAFFFNGYGLPNPSVDLTMGAYGTGALTVVNKNQTNGIGTGTPVSSTTLSGSKKYTPIYEYEVYNRGFQPHSAGVASFDRSVAGKKWNGSTYSVNGHQYADIFQTVHVSRVSISGDGSFSEAKKYNYTNLVGIKDLGAIVNKQKTTPEDYCTNGVVSVSCGSPGAVKFTNKALIDAPPAIQKSYIVDVATYKDTWGLFGKYSEIEKSEKITVYSKDEYKRLLQIESYKAAKSSESINNFLDRGYTAYDVAGYVPIVGEGLSAGEAIYGVDPKTGEKLSGVERSIAVIGAIPFAGKVKKGGDLAIDATKSIARYELKEESSSVAKKEIKSIISKSTDDIIDSGVKDVVDSTKKQTTEIIDFEEKIQKHHADPKFLGGDPKQRLVDLSESEHKALHKDLNEFLVKQVDENGNHMRPQKNNSGKKILENFGREKCLNALCQFYQGDGAKYDKAATEFFTQHPDLVK